MAVLSAFATEFARLDSRVAALQLELEPSTCDETLEDWQRNLGVIAAGTTAQQQATAQAKYVGSGGQSIAYYTAVANAMGITITISEAPYGTGLRADISRAGDYLYTDAYAFYWRVTGPAATAAQLQTELESLFDHIRPSHTVVEFAWTA